MEGKVKLVEGMQVGDYLLKRLIEEGEKTRTWEAEQISIKRDVILNSLRSAILTDHQTRNDYLADVRAKAKVDHPLIGTVVEAVQLEHNFFYASEKLTGKTLQAYVNEGHKFNAKDTVHILKQIAEANTYLEEHNMGTHEIQLHKIYIADGLLTRLLNFSIHGPRDPVVSATNKAMLGNIFKHMLMTDCPGYTRVNSLCDHMVDSNREIPITWDQIFDLSTGVEKKLREEHQHLDDSQHVPTESKVVRNLLITIGASIGLLAIIGIVAWIFVAPKRSHARDLSEMVYFEERITVNIGSEEVRVKPFAIDAHEVTIEEYAEFIRAAEEQGMKTFATRNIPKIIKHFYPAGSKENWEEMYQAAEQGLDWKGRTMGLNHPVTDVTYWCALAYKNWMNTRKDIDADGSFDLPSEAQWKAALLDEDYQQFTIRKWNAVDKNTKDVTTKGIHGLAGGVSEWTSKTVLDNDGRTQLPLVMGASFLDPEGGADKATYMQSRNKSRTDLGFRLVKTKK